MVRLRPPEFLALCYSSVWDHLGNCQQPQRKRLTTTAKLGRAAREATQLTPSESACKERRKPPKRLQLPLRSRQVHS